jgi:hypothetical protein
MATPFQRKKRKFFVLGQVQKQQILSKLVLSPENPINKGFEMVMNNKRGKIPFCFNLIKPQ